MGFVILAIIVIAFIVVITNISVVQQSRAYVIERLGAFHSVWGVGMHFKVPFIDRIARRVSLKEQVLDYPPQPVITKDNVTMQIDTVVYFQITDPKLYAYGVEQPMAAMETLTATTLRNIIGDLELDQTLTSRDVVNTKMRSILDEATDPWGIKVNRVELKNILPPQDIQNSMEKQMKAERDRRQAILQAEGQKKSAILIAEGEKESAILRADAEKQAAILKAEGEAEAIRKVQQALADSLEMLNRITDETLWSAKGKEKWVKSIFEHNQKIYIDSVSGLYNRRYYDEQLSELCSAQALVMLDVDSFKMINDSYGHQTGDAALHMIAQAVKSCVRSSDAVVRYGGDEFVIVLWGIPKNIFERKLAEIQKKVKELRMDDMDGLSFSVSIGGIYGKGKTAELLAKADKNMYRAKRTKEEIFIGILAEEDEEKENETTL